MFAEQIGIIKDRLNKLMANMKLATEETLWKHL